MNGVLDLPKLVISPMAGVTDAPFRHLALRYGADYGISEMITSQTNLWDSRKTQTRLKSNFIETPKILQIGGASPEVIAEAAKACAALNADAIEINMGCPAKKVCSVLAGSALLRDEGLVAEILASAVKAVELPIFLKTRLGWDHASLNILAIARLAEECGIKSLAIHGRTRSDYYNGSASYELIAAVKAEVRIPVFANGDINSPQKAAQVLSLTAADGLYIGRAALGQPWLFRQIKQYLASGGYALMQDRAEIKAVICEHVDLIHQHYGPGGIGIARKHLKWYLQANQQVLSAPLNFFAGFSLLESACNQLSYLRQL